MLKPVMLLLLASLACGANAAPLVTRCQGVPPPLRAEMLRLDAELTEAAAKRAVTELQQRVSGRGGRQRYDPQRFDRLMFLVQGWLMKQDWLQAWQRREHDADEALAYCTFLQDRARAS